MTKLFPFRKKPFPPIIPLLPVLLSLLCFGCKVTDHFAEYRGINMIPDKGFENGEWTTRREETYYANFEHPAETEALATGGLPDGAGEDSIYRLEIPNLMSNGDFENSTPGTEPAEWTSETSTGANFHYEAFSGSTANYADTGQAINGTSFYFNFSVDNSIQIRYDLRDLEDGLAEGSSYTIRFDLRATRETVFEYNNGTISYFDIPWIMEKAESLEVRSFPTELLDPQFTVQSGTNHYFVIGTFDEDTQKLQEAYLDNIRIVRTDIRNDLSLLIDPDELTEEGLEYLDGAYLFSVYVRQDPTNTTGDAPVANRMPATGVSLCIGIRRSDETADFTIPEAFHPDDEGADWSEWTEISIQVFLPFSQISDDESYYLELMIAATDTSAAGQLQDAGSVLISRPWLEYLPDGITSE